MFKRGTQQIIVGNIGTVYTGTDPAKAAQDYKEYKEQSQGNVGRAAGENVTWMVDGEIHSEFVGELATRDPERWDGQA